MALRCEVWPVANRIDSSLKKGMKLPPNAVNPKLKCHSSAKTVLTDSGPVRIEVPREREGTFEPQPLGKHERRLSGFDDKIIAMYARGMTVREIQGFMAEMYAVDVSPDLISSVTDAVLGEVAAWQARPLEAMCPVVYFDALRVNRWGCWPMAHATFWASGSKTPRVPSSG